MKNHKTKNFYLKKTPPTQEHLGELKSTLVIDDPSNLVSVLRR